MPVTNYTTLKVSIEDFSKRGDVTSLIDDFIDLTEAKLWEKLRIKEMGVRSTATASITSRFIALPDNYLAHRKMVFTSGTQQFDLDYKTPESMHVQSASGLPKSFTVTSQLEFDRIPDSTYTIENNHYAKLTALSASNLTNAIITNYPELYLWGGLYFLWAWAVDDKKTASYRALFYQAIDEINAQDRKGKHGPAPAARTEAATP